MTTGQRGVPERAAGASCGCTAPDPRIQMPPLSSACANGPCGGCDGFTDGYSTYQCGHHCHWCPSGLHRAQRPAGINP